MKHAVAKSSNARFVRRYRRFFGSTAALVLVTVAAACGGDDDDASPSEQEPAATTTEAESPDDTTPETMPEQPTDDAGTTGGSGEDPAPAEVSGEPVTVGASLGLTGFYAFIGADEDLGIDAAVQHVNQSGGVCGRPFEVIVTDNESDSRLAADGVQRLVQRDGVPVVIMDNTPTVVASIPVANQLEVPLVTIGSGLPPAFSEEELYWSFDNGSISWQLEGFAEYWRANGITKVAFIAADSPLADIATVFLDANADEFEVTSSQKFAPGTTDLTPFVLNIPDGGAEAILSWTTGQDQANTIRTYKNLGVDIPFFSIGGAITSPAFVDAAGGPDTLDGIFTVAPPALIREFLPEGDLKGAVEAYFAAMDSAGHDAKEGASFATVGWDAGIQVAQAINEACETGGPEAAEDPAAIREALENQRFVSVQSGVIQRSPSNHSGSGNSYTVVIYQSGDGWVPAGL